MGPRPNRLLMLWNLGDSLYSGTLDWWSIQAGTELRNFLWTLSRHTIVLNIVLNRRTTTRWIDMFHSLSTITISWHRLGLTPLLISSVEHGLWLIGLDFYVLSDTPHDHGVASVHARPCWHLSTSILEFFCLHNPRFWMTTEDLHNFAVWLYNVRQCLEELLYPSLVKIIPRDW